MPQTSIESGPISETARRPRWRRRRYVVDSRYQMKSGILVGAFAAALLILLNASMLTEGGGRSDAGWSWILILLGSAVFLGGAILVGVVESHRTAGAAFAIRRSVDALAEGKPGVRIRLRRTDELQDLARSINKLAEALDRERAARG